jgi:hypothetical protein
MKIIAANYGGFGVMPIYRQQWRPSGGTPAALTASDRVAMHAVRRTLLRHRLPATSAAPASNCRGRANETYERRMAVAVAALRGGLRISR